MTDPFDLEAQLLPEQLRRLLATSAVLLAADRLLRAAIVDALIEFKCSTFEEPEAAPPPSVSDPALDACLGELVEKEILTSSDASTVRSLREHVVDITARLPELLLNPGPGIRHDLLHEAEIVLRKIGVFWARVSMDCDERYDGREIDDNDITPGPSRLLGELRQAAALI